jgi:choice-of-anchor B domain-containing protein
MRMAVVWGVVIVGSVLVGVARGSDLTFNTSLVSQYNPINAVHGGSTNNFYAGLWAEGNVAVLGSLATKGAMVIDISNPAAPSMAGWYNPADGGQFRDVSISNGIGYFAIDDASSPRGGVHVVDLSNPENPVKIAEINASNNGFHRVHNVFISDGLLYLASNQNRTLKVFNISNPAAPVHVRDVATAGAFNDNLHDITVKNGRLYTSNITNGWTEVYDVSDITSPSWSAAGRLITSFNTGTRNHSNWPSEDGNLVAVAREMSDGDVQLWDISNPSRPVQVAALSRSMYGLDAFSPHDPVIIGDILYVSWYQAGLQIFNISNPSSPVHIGAYDTFAGGAGQPGSFLNYDGNWGVFPFFGAEKVLLSDMDGGLFIVDARLPGDANLDGKVNIADLGILAANWQQQGQWGHGDFTGNGTVDIADLGILAASWQVGVTGPAEIGFTDAMGLFDAFNGIMVPEPGMAGLLLGVGAFGMRRGRSR